MVALCDNRYQGIVPVPAALGNGQDPGNNLYWGAMYGVKSYLSRQPGYLLRGTSENPQEHVLERAVFQYRDTLIIADAYDGKRIKEAIQDFFSYAAGQKSVTARLGRISVKCGGDADLLVFVGHDAFMDGDIPVVTAPGPSKKTRKTAVFACYSRDYFRAKLVQVGAEPLILTNGLMAPEAYNLEALIEGWATGQSNREIHERVALAYHKYQKTSIAAARKLFYYPEK